VGEQIEEKVDELAQGLADKVSTQAAAMDVLRDVIASDWGRLEALGSVVSGDEWAVKGVAVSRLRTAARRTFSSELMPVPFGVYSLQRRDAKQVRLNSDTCHHNYGFPWKGAAPSAQLPWMGNFDIDFYQGWWPTQLILGRHSLPTFDQWYPSPELTNAMFSKDVTEDHYGMRLDEFMWEQYEAPHPEQRGGFPPTDIFVCDDKSPPAP
jgi:hypothetical protein